MKFYKWFEKNGMSMYSFARMCNLSRATIKNLVEGKPTSVKTVKRLILVTKSMSPPIDWNMFSKIKGKKRGKK